MVALSEKEFQNKVIAFLMLEYFPHAIKIFFGVPPDAQGIHIPKV
jgi:hypothetical protein